MKKASTAPFRIIVQTREGDKWQGKEWIYVTARQMQFIVQSLASAGVTHLIAGIIKPTVSNILGSLWR